MSDYKQVVVVRTDIKMGKGKLAAQVAHAAVAAAEMTRKDRPEWFEAWMSSGQKKIVVKASTLDELLALKKAAEERGIPTVVISDAGYTQLEPGTITALGIGPAPSELVDKVTGHLKLL